MAWDVSWFVEGVLGESLIFYSKGDLRSIKFFLFDKTNVWNKHSLCQIAKKCVILKFLNKKNIFGLFSNGQQLSDQQK